MLSDDYNSTIEIADSSGSDTIDLVDWQDTALLVLGFDGQQTLNQGINGEIVKLTLVNGNDVENATEDSGDLLTHNVFKPSDKPVDELVVDLTNNELDHTIDSSTGLSLREALLWAKTDAKTDIISFSLSGAVELDGPLDIDTAVSIEGPRTIGQTQIIEVLSGSTNRIFEVTPEGRASLKFLTLTGGEADHGGAIYAEGSLTLFGTTIENSKATGIDGAGGGIDFAGLDGAQLRIINSIIHSNEADLGAGINISAGDALIVGSTIYKNGFVSVAEEGAGVRLDGDAKLSILNSTISQNHAVEGGGVYSNATGAEIPVITTSTIAYNNATSSGSGLFIAGTSTVLHGTLFAHNVGATIAGTLDSSSTHYLDDDTTLPSVPAFTQETGDRTPYHALLDAPNPAINIIANHGPGEDIPSYDQRGKISSNSGNRDIGAHEHSGILDPAQSALPAVGGYINEDAKSGDFVLRYVTDETLVARAEPESRFFTYKIVDGNPGDVFAIDPDTGDISIADSSLLDFELAPGYLLTIQATNLAPPNDVVFGVARIEIRDVNEAPIFNGPYSFEISDQAYAGDLVGTVLATDPEGSQVDYALVGSNGAFKIDSATGAISVADPGKLSDSSTLHFQVTASESGSAQIGASAAVSVAVLTTEVPKATIELPDIPRAEYAVSHNRSLTFNPVGGDANASGKSYRVVYGSGSNKVNVDYELGKPVQVSGRATFRYGKLSANSNGTLTYVPKDDLVERNKLNSRSNDGSYYYARENLSYQIYEFYNGVVGDTIGTKQPFTLDVTNSLPVLRSEYLASQSDGTLMLDGSILVDTDTLVRLDIRDLFYDPDSDVLVIQQITNTGPNHLESDSPVSNAAGKIETTFGHNFVPGGNSLTYKSLFLEKNSTRSYLLDLTHDAAYDTNASSSTFTSLGYPKEFTFEISISDGQELSKDGAEASFGITVAPWNELGGTTPGSTQYPWLDVRDRTLGTSVIPDDSVLGNGNDWSISTAEVRASRGGTSVQPVGDASVDLINGTLLRRHTLPFDRSGDASESPLSGLIYDSATADPRPVVQVTVDPPNDFDTSKIHTILARLRWYDHIKGFSESGNIKADPQITEVTIDATLLSDPGSNSWHFALRPSYTPLLSGVYDWEVEIEIHTQDPAISLPTDFEVLTLTQSGQTAVVVEKTVTAGLINNPEAARNYTPQFGNGWAVEGAPKLFLDSRRGIDLLSDPSVLADDFFVLWFPGEKPRVFKRDPIGSEQDEVDTFSETLLPIDLSTGLKDPSEFGSLKLESQFDIIDDNLEEAVVYRSREGLEYVFEANATTAQPDWLLREIRIPGAGSPVQFHYVTASTTLDKIINIDLSETKFDLNGDIRTNNVVRYQLDKDGDDNLEQITHVNPNYNNRVRRFDYDDSERMTKDWWYDDTSSPSGNMRREVTFGYNPKGFLSSIKYGEGSTQRTYGITPVIASGLNTLDEISSPTATVKQVSDIASGNWWTKYTYDSDYNLRRKGEIFGSSANDDNGIYSTEYWSYDHIGSVTGYADPLGRITYFDYDYQNPIKVTGRDGRDPNNRVPLYDKDDFRGNVTQIISPAGTTSLIYETADKAGFALGRLVEETNPQGFVTIYERNNRGELTKRIVGDNAATEQWDYYEAGLETGLLEKYTSPLGLTTTYVYDSHRRVDNTTTTDSGNTFGQEVTYTEYVYDDTSGQVGYLDSIISSSIGPSSGSAEQFSRTEYDYDNSGFLRGLVIKDGSNNVISQQSLSYDPDGRIIKEVSGVEGTDATITSYLYDKGGLLSESTQYVDRDSTLTNRITSTYAYYSDGSLYTTTLPDNTLITETYNPRFFDSVLNEKVFLQTTTTDKVATLTEYTGETVNVADDESVTIRRKSDAAGRLLQEENLLTGALTEYIYDDVRFDAPTRIVSDVNLGGGSGNDVEVTTFFKYDAQGNVSYEKTSEGIQRSYQYDALGDLRKSEVVAANGAEFAYEYDAAGNLISQVETRKNPIAATDAEPHLITTNFKYDDSGRLRRSEDTADHNGIMRDVKVDYSLVTDPGLGSSKLQRVSTTSREDDTTHQYFDAAGQLVREENAFGGATTFEYDQSGNLKKTIFTPAATDGPDITTRITTFRYDGLGRVIETIQHGSSEAANTPLIKTETKYNDTFSDSWDVEVTEFLDDNSGVVTRYQYDSLGTLVAMRQGATTETGQPIEGDDDLLTLVSYSYGDNVVFVTARTTSPRGEDDLDDGGNRDHDETTVTRQVLNTTGDLLDVRVRTSGLEISDTADHGTGSGYELRQQNIYYVPGLLNVTKDGSNNFTAYNYVTGSGTPQVSFINRSDQTITNVYDSAGNRVRQILRWLSDPKNNGNTVVPSFIDTITWAYDDLGRLIHEATAIDVPNASSGNPSFEEVTRTWKYEGAKKIYTDRNGVSVSDEFVAATITSAAKREGKSWNTNETIPDYTSTFTFNSDGSLRVATDEWLTGDQDDDQSSVAYTYDEFGRLDTETSNHKFNNLVAPTTVVDVEVDDNGGTEIYHKNGVRKRAVLKVDGTSIYQNDYEIDERGRISGLTQALASGATLWSSTSVGKNKGVRIAYNANSTREKLYRGPDANVPTDNLSQSIALTTYAYRDDGNLETLRNLRKATTAAADDPAALEISKYLYGYNSSGRISGIFSAFDEGSGTSPNILHVDDSRTGYNNRGEFQSISPNFDNNITDDTANSATYQKDIASNLANNGQEIGRLNRLYSDSAGNSYLYDDEGRITNTKNVTKLGSGITITYDRLFAWDHRGLLQTVTGSTLTETDEGDTSLTDTPLEFYYDVLGRKVARHEGADQTVFVWDGNDLALEVDVTSGSPQITRGYFNGPGVNEVLAIDQTHGTASIDIDTVWQFADHLGTVRTVGVHTSGNVEAGADWALLHRSLNPAGELVNFAGKTISKLGDVASSALSDTPTIFAGHQFDDSLDLYDMRARWYDPASQRFLSEDPLGEAGGSTNLYVYAGGDPVNNIDPNGKVIVIAGLTIGVVAGYLATQGGISAVETGVEYAAIQYFGSQEDINNFSIAATFGKNFAINVATGGIGGKAKTAGRAAALFAARQAIEIGGDTALDVGYYGRDLQSSLIGNIVGSLVGEGIGAAIGSGARAFHRNFEVSFDPASATSFNTSLGFVQSPLRIQRRVQLAPDEARLLQLQEIAASRKPVSVPQSFQLPTSSASSPVSGSQWYEAFTARYGAENVQWSRIPAYSGGKTQGVLATTVGDIDLISGYAGPSAAMGRGQVPGMNYHLKAHVEAHAASAMRQLRLNEATLYLNQVPCVNSRGGCEAMLPRMLGEGRQLRVVVPGQLDRIYNGIAP